MYQILTLFKNLLNAGRKGRERGKGKRRREERRKGEREKGRKGRTHLQFSMFKENHFRNYSGFSFRHLPLYISTYTNIILHQYDLLYMQF